MNGDTSETLYGWWLNLIPNFLGAASGAVLPKAAAPADGAAGQPFPVGQASQALAMTQQLLGPLFQGYLQALAAHPHPEQAFTAFHELTQGQLQKLSSGLSGIARAGGLNPPADMAGWNLVNHPMAMFGQAMKPLSTNLERAYGGLADAFGLAPSRDLQGAAREMAGSAFAKQQAQAEYLGLVVAALGKASEGLMARLADMGQKGESVDSLLGLVRLWARSADETMHAAMQSPKAVEASAKLVRAATRSRQQQHRIVAIVSEALNVPTRAEVDDAYREIQELKREMRRLRKALGVPAVAVAVPAADAAPVPADVAPAPGRTRAATPAPATAVQLGEAAPFAAAAPAPARKRTRATAAAPANAPAAKRRKTSKVTAP